MLELTDKEFNSIREYIKANYGINLSSEKKTLVYSRLKTTVQEMGFDSFADYFNYVVKDKSGAAMSKFIDKITTNHTFFMREREHFDYLTSKVLPIIESKHTRSKDLRIWCAGCSTGEEAYTLQILLKEYFQNKPGWNTQILATDISKKVLSKAYNGIYLNTSLSALPVEWRDKYFHKYDEESSVAVDALKKDIIFRSFNLMEDNYNFKKKFQVIFCRNVMIYFDGDTRQDLVNKMYSATEDGGYFFIGHSESLNHTDTKFQYVLPAVYRKEEKG